MKLRIWGNKIRLRLRTGDFDALLSGDGVVEHMLEMPSEQSFMYRLKVSNGEKKVDPIFKNGVLDVVVPMKALEALLNSPEQEGLHYQFDTAGTPLKVAVEKDFPCQHDHVDEPNDYSTCFDRF